MDYNLGQYEISDYFKFLKEHLKKYKYILLEIMSNDL